MKERILLVVVMLMFGSGNVMATDWDNIDFLPRHSTGCLKELQLGKVFSAKCEDIDSKIYLLKYADLTVKDYKSVPSFVFRGESIRFSGGLSIPIADMVIPVSKGKEGNYVTVSLAGRFVRLDDDDPLRRTQKGALSNIIFIVEAVKGRPPTFVEKLVGEVIVDKEFSGSIVQYKASKTIRLMQSAKEEAKVRIFGLPLYGANRDSLLITMKKNSIERVGAVDGYSSDVFDTSKAVKGAARLDAFYAKDGSIGRLTYHFDDVALDSVLKRFSKVYGPPHVSQSVHLWNFGRITISLYHSKDEKTESSGPVFVTYSVVPFSVEIAESNLERENSMDSNAF